MPDILAELLVQSSATGGDQLHRSNLFAKCQQMITWPRCSVVCCWKPLFATSWARQPKARKMPSAGEAENCTGRGASGAAGM